VLQLQTQIEAVEASIKSAETAICASRGRPRTQAKATIVLLEDTHQDLTEQAEQLYASLNIDVGLPEIAGHGLEFTRLLLQARDLKAAIRTRLVGRFFEWERLDQAAGGIGPALG
jgi:hypothetical protein